MARDETQIGTDPIDVTAAAMPVAGGTLGYGRMEDAATGFDVRFTRQTIEAIEPCGGVVECWTTSG
ncbi:MAG: hypothetical protein R3C56_34930 [Pirellulaceae bacterium]